MLRTLGAVCVLWSVLPCRCDLDFVSYDYDYVAADSTRPEQTVSWPANRSDGASPETHIEITFSEQVVPGDGYVELSSPGDVRRIHARDAQISRGRVSNNTLEVWPDEPLQNDAEYRIDVLPGFARDLAGNNHLGSRFYFRTAGPATDFAVFAPHVQAPDSPVIFAFRTMEHGMYDDEALEYRLQLWPSADKTFHLPASQGPDGVDGRCARVLELSSNFPPLLACGRTADGGRYELQLGSTLRAATEYSLVVRWPVQQGMVPPSAAMEVNWHLSILRENQGVFVEVQSFKPWRHRFGYYYQNSIDDTVGSIDSFKVFPGRYGQLSDAAAASPRAVQEFRVEVALGNPGLLPGSRLLLFASPMLLWSITPARPMNLTMLTSLDFTDPLHLADEPRRATPCPSFFPGELPFTVQCRLLELGFGHGVAYGMELRVPLRGRGAAPLSGVTRSFYLTVPGPVAPIAVSSFWEMILVHPGRGPGGVAVHSTRRESGTAAELKTTAALDLVVVSSAFPYPAPVGTHLNEVELELVSGVFALGYAEVLVELLEPPLARLETCEGRGRWPRLAGEPQVAAEPHASARWRLDPFEAAAGETSAVLYPGMRYRMTCLVYNGPRPAKRSSWRLTITSWRRPGAENFTVTRSFVSDRYFVAALFIGAQVTPTLPVLNRWQALFVRVQLPGRDGVTLAHFTEPAHRLDLVAPRGYRLAEGACRGFRSLSASALPPRPLAACWTAPESPQVFRITIDQGEPGFLPGKTYAFRVMVLNPATQDDVESRVVRQFTSPANQWVLVLRQTSDGSPLIMLEDIPQSFAFLTAALNPVGKPKAGDTSFRLFRRQLNVLALAAEDPYIGRRSRVFFRFQLGTPLRVSDALQISAPSSFEFERVYDLRGSFGFAGADPFPGSEVTVSGSLVVITVATQAEHSVPYTLVLGMTMPASWSSLDRELNYWVFETFHSTVGLLDKRSRRDAGVRQGFLVKGSLLDCAVAPSNRVRGEAASVSFALRVNEPVVAADFGQPPGPSRLRVQLPLGFRFATVVPNGDCSALLLPGAPSDSPPLPAAQFPHGYASLPPLNGLSCFLDRSVLELARVLTVEVVGAADVGLLTSFLYAFRVHVINPDFDRIWGASWILETTNRSGHVFESCSVDSEPGLQGSAIELRAAAAALPGGLAAVELKVSADSPFFQVGSAVLEVVAPAGLVFLRDCVASITVLVADSWKVRTCHGYMSSARMTLSAVIGGPLRLLLRPRTVARAGLQDPLLGGLASWSVLGTSGGEPCQGVALASAPPTRVMGPVSLQPLLGAAFEAADTRQAAVLAFELPAALAPGALLELELSRLAPLRLDAAQPCAGLWEDPETLLPIAVPTAAADAALAPAAVAAAPSPAPVAAPALPEGCTEARFGTCELARAGSRALLRLSRRLDAGIRYCAVLYTRGPLPNQAVGPAALSAAARRGAALPRSELAPLTTDDRGRGWGVAPTVPGFSHFSLCFGSRIAGDFAVDVTVHIAPGSLGLSAEGRTAASVRVCLSGVEAPAAGEALTCRVEGAAAGTARCSASPASGPGTVPGVCAEVSGAPWVPFGALHVVLPLRLAAAASPSARAAFLDGHGAVLQQASATARLPVLPPLSAVAMDVPRTTAATLPFPVALAVGWSSMGAAFLDALVEAEEEPPAYLDVATPPGVRLSLSCEPLPCSRIAPDPLVPLPGVRLFLRDAAASSEALSLAGLPAELRLTATAAFPLAPGAVADGNIWSFVLRAESERALAAASLPGFGIALPMALRVGGSSRRAGDVFARFVVELALALPLGAGDVIVFYAPPGAGTCTPSAVDPPHFAGLSAYTPPGGWPSGGCAIGLREPMLAGATYAFSMLSVSPILTPYPNTWFVQTYSFANGSSAAAPALHSVAEAEGYEVAGEFEIFEVLTKSGYPGTVTPAAIRFKLRTPFPPLEEAAASASGQEPIIRLRITAAAPFSTAGTFSSFGCLLDSSRAEEPLPAVDAEEAVLPDDCLALDGGAAVDFRFYRPALEAERRYVLWTRLAVPAAGAAAAGLTLLAETSVATGGGRAVHRGALRPPPLLGIRAAVLPSSLALGASHRVVVTVFAGRAVLGQRGALVVTLPRGFEARCGTEDFRPRPALPQTARCRSLAGTLDDPDQVVVSWRTLFGAEELRPPYEFAFRVVNPPLPLAAGDPGGAWHVKLFEGDNQELPVDATAVEGLRPFELCMNMTVLHQREDATVVTVMFTAPGDLPEGFDNVLRVQLWSSARAPATLACPETAIWARRPDRDGYIASGMQGLPKYTVCAQAPADLSPPDYHADARQHLSELLFLLPFGTFQASGQSFGLELRVLRGRDAAAAEAQATLEALRRSDAAAAPRTAQDGAAAAAELAAAEGAVALAEAYVEAAGGRGASTRQLEQELLSESEAAAELLGLQLESGRRPAACGSVALGAAPLAPLTTARASNASAAAAEAAEGAQATEEAAEVAAPASEASTAAAAAADADLGLGGRRAAETG